MMNGTDNELVVVEISNVPQEIQNGTNKAIRNILNIVEAAFGNKLDYKQQKMVRKIVLDEINDLKNLFIILYENGGKNGKM